MINDIDGSPPGWYLCTDSTNHECVMYWDGKELSTSPNCESSYVSAFHNFRRMVEVVDVTPPKGPFSVYVGPGDWEWARTFPTRNEAEAWAQSVNEAYKVVDDATGHSVEAGSARIK